MSSKFDLKNRLLSYLLVSNIYLKVYPNPLKTCSYLGNPNLADMVDVGRIIFHRGPGPIKRTNTKGTQVLIWNGKIIDPSANTEESGELDRSVCSLITQGLIFFR